MLLRANHVDVYPVACLSEAVFVVRCSLEGEETREASVMIVSRGEVEVPGRGIWHALTMPPAFSCILLWSALTRYHIGSTSRASLAIFIPSIDRSWSFAVLRISTSSFGSFVVELRFGFHDWSSGFSRASLGSFFALVVYQG
ncbi:hypothetical protein PM082_021521 [Marasmius tenuissimus]|nr:hypothetical protein PM082_021521 [Marasmius tenuissimus]